MATFVAVLGLGVAGSTSARAEFIVDTSPGGDAISLANGVGTSDIATVDGEVINITTGTQQATFASGNATIKPVTDRALTSIMFTPEDPNAFDAFSFRGQLTVAGQVVVTLVDNGGQTFTFDISNANQDFDRIGIIAVPGTDETIKSVTITGNFKEQKQTDFSKASAPVVPEPTTMIAGALLLLPFGVSTLRILRKKSAA